MAPIRRLPDVLIDRIAAGEVVERPASVVKELVENAIDAGADAIDVVVTGGGRDLIVVTDNGAGMTADDLALAVERHATSKLGTDDLSAIATLGFRGEALPSIGAVARLRITSRARGADDAWQVAVTGGTKEKPTPAAHPPGTRVEVRDLFYATPARLKFLKAPRTEFGHALDVVRRLAMTHPEIAFSVADEDRTPLKVAADRLPLSDARRVRLAQVLGREFTDNALAIGAAHGGIEVQGLAGLPTLARPTAQAQYLFVNGRPVRDRQLASAVRPAYQELIARDRHPMVAIFVTAPPGEVDVNVHPAKTEVRFRDAQLVRGLIIAAIRRALAAGGHRTATAVAADALAAFGSAAGYPRPPEARPHVHAADAAAAYHAPLDAAALGGFARDALGGFARDALGGGFVPAARVEPPEPAAVDHPLGAARGQLHETYIVAQTGDGLVIVDQHAAHERLVFERMKAELDARGVQRQILLIPEVVEVDPAAAERVLGRAAEFADLGLAIEPFGDGAVLVREVPALLGEVDTKGLVQDLADELAEADGATSLRERLSEVASRMACHGSVRAGRALSVAEMNALLREMERTPHAGQCTHGRPTYIELKLTDIERLFGRR
ncbi:MAG: DNA mismatch repair endonuclease MutL [Alphaproteobacteria bacterium]|nr:DNA mismatch repair endonuclease MutL [Alphaproteobacteria bacterium]